MTQMFLSCKNFVPSSGRSDLCSLSVRGLGLGCRRAQNITCYDVTLQMIFLADWAGPI